MDERCVFKSNGGLARIGMNCALFVVVSFRHNTTYDALRIRTQELTKFFSFCMPFHSLVSAASILLLQCHL